MRNGYRFGVDWIAQNDEPTIMEVEEVAFQISTLLLADLFNRDPMEVGRDIVKRRQQINARTGEV